jgi:hypothetical protein
MQRVMIIGRQAMLKKTVLIILLYLTSFLARGQAHDVESSKHGIKLNINYSKVNNRVDFGNLAPVYVRTSKRSNFNEIELNKLRLETKEIKSFDAQTKITDHVRNRAFEIGIRYQFTWSIMKRRKIQPQLGFSFLSLYSRHQNYPLMSSSYERHWTNLREQISLIPQARYNFYKRFFADLGFPLEFFDIGFVQQHISNPAIPSGQQTNGGIEVDQNWGVFHLRLHYIRVGIGVKI